MARIERPLLAVGQDADAEADAVELIDIPPADALSLRTWILGLIPLNPIKAAADGTLLPVVLFTLLYAFALGKVSDGPRAAQLAFFRGMADTMLVVVRWSDRVTACLVTCEPLG